MNQKSQKPFLNIRLCLTKYGMNFTELGKMVGLNTPAISKRMSKKLPWKLPELEIMSEKFNMSIDELVK